MKFKIDENLPAECAPIFREAGFETATVAEQELSGSSGIVVVRSNSQDKATLISIVKRTLPVLIRRSPEQQLWIVEPDRIRYRED